MISLLKAILPGALLAWTVSLFIGSAGSRGGFLYVHQVVVMGFEFYWSWLLFIAGTALTWAILIMMK